VSGSGKTRAMLELKKTLLKALDDAMETDNDKTLNITAVAFGYAGFNSGLPLTDDETRYITNENTARTVLLRRIVGSVLVSQEEPTRLPKKIKLYEDFHFPSEKDLIAMLVKYLKPPSKGTNNFAVLVVGIDEVQLLNKMKEVNGDGIGRIFLRTARQLQVELLTRANILLVPVGTGVLLDFSTDGSTGDNKTLSSGHDEDVTLISKDDFRALAEAKYDSKANGFKAQYGQNAKETVLDKVTALWWPRVTFIQKWKPQRDIDIVQSDSNSQSWLEWLNRWMQDKPFSISDPSDSSFIPGKQSEF
jgi:hypothetical protein